MDSEIKASFERAAPTVAAKPAFYGNYYIFFTGKFATWPLDYPRLSERHYL